MEPVIVTLVLLAIGIALSVPIGIAIGFATLVGVWYGDLPLEFFTQKFFNNFDSFPLMAVPFFIMAGDIMSHGSLSDSLLRLCRTTCGHLRGGLAHISIITALFYGALCGSAAATTAAVGGTMIPAMEKDKYPKSFATAVNAAGGCLGVMIPPSIPLILYGAFGNVSVGDLFLAGILPGCLVAMGFCLTAAIITKRKNYGILYERSSWKERWEALKGAAFALGVPVIVLGAIYGGIATPTEAGCFAVVYAIVVELFITKSMKLRDLFDSLVTSLRTLGIIIIVIVTANALGTFLLYYNVQDVLLSTMRSITDDPHIFMLLMLVMFLILGTFVEATAIILILTPLLVPMAVSYGINPVHFGIFMLVSLCIGFLTPPVGTNLFVGCSISGVNIMVLSRTILPFIFSMIISVLIIAFVPALSLILI